MKRVYLVLPQNDNTYKFMYDTRRTHYYPLSPKNMSRTFSVALLSMLASLLLVFPLLFAHAQEEFPVDVLMDYFESAIIAQDADRIRKAFTTELDAQISLQLVQTLDADTTITSFDLYGYEVTPTAENAWHVESKYSIDARGPNGTWSSSGLSTFIDFEQRDDLYFITDTDLHEALVPVSTAKLFEVVSGFLAFALIPILLLIAFQIWMIYDVVKYQQKDRALLIIIVVLANTIGALIYFFTERRRRVKGA